MFDYISSNKNMRRERHLAKGTQLMTRTLRKSDIRKENRETTHRVKREDYDKSAGRTRVTAHLAKREEKRICVMKKTCTDT